MNCVVDPSLSCLLQQQHVTAESSGANTTEHSERRGAEALEWWQGVSQQRIAGASLRKQAATDGRDRWAVAGCAGAEDTGAQLQRWLVNRAGNGIGLSGGEGGRGGFGGEWLVEGGGGRE